MDAAHVGDVPHFANATHGALAFGLRLNKRIRAILTPRLAAVYARNTGPLRDNCYESDRVIRPDDARKRTSLWQEREP